MTGGLFTAGMQYWQLGEAHYWGHNAIIRVEPFMQHCALAKLPGTGALAGDINRRCGESLNFMSDAGGFAAGELK